MTNIEILVCKTALKKMEKDGYFSICVIDNILKMSNGVPNGKLYQMLRTLHCVNFSDMPEELLSDLPKMIGEVLSSTPLNLFVGDIFVNVLATPTKSLNCWK